MRRSSTNIAPSSLAAPSSSPGLNSNLSRSLLKYGVQNYPPLHGGQRGRHHLWSAHPASINRLLGWAAILQSWFMMSCGLLGPSGCLQWISSPLHCSLLRLLPLKPKTDLYMYPNYLVHFFLFGQNLTLSSCMICRLDTWGFWAFIPVFNKNL